MNKNTILLLIVVVLAVGAYFLFMSADKADTVLDKNSEIEYYDDGKQVVYCDVDGNRYDTVAEAKAAGLAEAEYGATYCPEYVNASNEDYIGMNVADAEAKAEADGVMFRVVELDGETQPTTRDFREGRINATVVGDVVTDYSVETNSPASENDHDVIIGMTTVEAEAYAEENEIDFRTGTIDGVGMPVTMDFRPGRITAEIENDVVIGYTVE